MLQIRRGKRDNLVIFLHVFANIPYDQTKEPSRHYSSYEVRV